MTTSHGPSLISKIGRTLRNATVMLFAIGFLCVLPSGNMIVDSLESAYLKGELKVLVQPPNESTSLYANPTHLSIELFQRFAETQNLKLSLAIGDLNDLPDTKVFDLVALSSTPPTKPIQYRLLKASSQLENTETQHHLNWATPATSDPELSKQVTEFLDHAIESGLMAELESRFFFQLSDKHQAERYYFARHMRTRLPQYAHLFQQTGKELNVDWKLLAAISYQESQWDPKAVSPTGVRGMMMLTKRTAKEVDVKDRTQPDQSIFGGAKYFLKTRDRLPPYILEPDRTWIALAAYNMGYSHIIKAIQETHAKGGQPSDWFQVKEQLPPPKYQKKKRYLMGSDQAKAYVSSIRYYYDLLSQPGILAEALKLDSYQSSFALTDTEYPSSATLAANRFYPINLSLLSEPDLSTFSKLLTP